MSKRVYLIVLCMCLWEKTFFYFVQNEWNINSQTNLSLIHYNIKNSHLPFFLISFKPSLTSFYYFSFIKTNLFPGWTFLLTQVLKWGPFLTPKTPSWYANMYASTHPNYTRTHVIHTMYNHTFKHCIGRGLKN